MTRLCLIGNSHLAAMKLGWELVKPRYPDIELTYFGAGSHNLKDIAVEKDCLVPTTDRVRESFLATSSGRSIIDATLYDVFIVCGLKFRFPITARLFAKFSPHSIGRDTKYLLSDDFFKAIVASSYVSSLAYETAQKLRQVTDKKIVIVPPPALSEAACDGRAFLTRFRDSCDGEAVSKLLQDAADELDDRVADIVWQPARTVAHGIFTRAEFSIGSVTLHGNEAHAEDDHLHMNAEYGAAMMEELIDSLQLGGAGVESAGFGVSEAMAAAN